MARVCTICTHEAREDIDRAIVDKVSNRRIASQHDVTERAVRNHKANHLPAKLVMAEKAEEVAQADDLLHQMWDIQTRTLAILEATEQTHEHRVALSAIREARSNLELLAKLVGELDESPTVNILIAPHVQQVIVQALAPYPTARRAVADALAELEAA